MQTIKTLREIAQSGGDSIEQELSDQCRLLWGDNRPSRYLIVIPAYNEADSLPYVASRIPKSIHGIAPTVLVIDDGSTDQTAAVAKNLGLNTISSPVNRGQGASLRSGYLIAINFDFSAVAIVDADGQWDPADLELVMTPIIEGRAEITQGSRSLGETHVGDAFRDLGVVFFAKLISVVTRTQVTDTSSGIRAMSVGILEKIRLCQPQYQSSELLISALFAGGRLVEIPVVMSPRFAGSTKKGNNLIYAFSYAKVVIGTSLREASIHRLVRRQRAKARIIGTA